MLLRYTAAGLMLLAALSTDQHGPWQNPGGVARRL